MKQTHYDLVILGSGSTAFAAALGARELGKTSVMTEERTTGGTCVNRGCLPSKNLVCDSDGRTKRILNLGVLSTQ